MEMVCLATKAGRLHKTSSPLRRVFPWEVWVVTWWNFSLELLDHENCWGVSLSSLILGPHTHLNIWWWLQTSIEKCTYIQDFIQTVSWESRTSNYLEVEFVFTDQVLVCIILLGAAGFRGGLGVWTGWHITETMALALNHSTIHYVSWCRVTPRANPWTLCCQTMT